MTRQQQGQIVSFFSRRQHGPYAAIFHAGIAAGVILRPLLDELEACNIGINRQCLLHHVSRLTQDDEHSQETGFGLRMAQNLMKEYQALGVPVSREPFIQGLAHALRDSEWQPEWETAQHFSALNARIRGMAGQIRHEQNRNKHNEM